MSVSCFTVVILDIILILKVRLQSFQQEMLSQEVEQEHLSKLTIGLASEVVMLILWFVVYASEHCYYAI